MTNVWGGTPDDSEVHVLHSTRKFGLLGLPNPDQASCSQAVSEGVGSRARTMSSVLGQASQVEFIVWHGHVDPETDGGDRGIDCYREADLDYL